MGLRYGNKDGTYEVMGGADPKLKGGLLRSNPLEPAEGKADKGRQRPAMPARESPVADDRDEEIKALKRELKDRGDENVELRKDLAEVTADRDRLRLRVEGMVDTVARPWEALGISERTYYYRKKTGKL